MWGEVAWTNLEQSYFYEVNQSFIYQNTKSRSCTNLIMTLINSSSNHQAFS
jgi:hypothetical protein